MEIIQRTSKSLAAILVLGSLAVTSNMTSAQQDHEPEHSPYKFTLASVCGDYGAVATYGANIARALGTEKADGRGKLTGAAIVNQPGPNNTRTLSSIGIAGTYVVNTNGTGIMVLTITLPNGSTASVTEDFVITKAKVVDGIAIATEIVDAQEEPSAVIDNSGFVTHTYTLRTAAKSCTRE
jgi:hypothetical protein